MLDLRVLRDLWTEDGARRVFSQLVTHCVRSDYPDALSIRPSPGDEGIDTLVGDFESQVRVYQAKYFCDGLYEAQRSQIRASWKTCVESKYFKHLVLWTLCIPIEMSTDEVRWWQGWRSRQMSKHQVQMELWTSTHFEAFRATDSLQGVFDLALRPPVGQTIDELLAALQSRLQRLASLPSPDHLCNALFVKKIEAAGILQHRAARTAFYNFELLREAVTAGGTREEVGALEDLQERIYELWEELYNRHLPAGMGRPLYNAVNQAIVAEHNGRLRCDELGAQVAHKKGGLHYWADICQAGWTANFEAIGREPEPGGANT